MYPFFFPLSPPLPSSIFLQLDPIELLRKYISSDSRSGGKRSDTVHPPIHRWFDAIFTWNGAEEITVKARKFAFVEISRMPPLYHSASFFPPFFLFSPSLPPYRSYTTEPLTLFLSPSLGFPPNFRTNLYIFECESGGWIECVSPLQFPSLSFFLFFSFIFYTCFLFSFLSFFFYFIFFFDSLLLLFRPNFTRRGINNISVIGEVAIVRCYEMANENYFASFSPFFLRFTL